MLAYSAGITALGCQERASEPRVAVLLEPIRTWTLTGDLVPSLASAIDSASVVFVARDGQRVFRLDEGVPTLLATLGGAKIEAVTVTDGLVWLASGNQLYSVGLRDGDAELRFTLSDSARSESRLVVGPSGIVVGEEVLAEASDGTQRGGCGNWIVGIQANSDPQAVSSDPPIVRI